MASQKPSFITEVRKLFGMWKDFFPRAQPGDQFYLPKDKYIDAENIRLSDQAVPNLGTASLTTGNEYEFDLGYQASSGITVYKGYRIAFDISAINIIHVITINGTASGNLSSAAGSKAGRYAALVAALEGAAPLAGFTPDVYISAPDLTLDVVHVGFKFLTGDYILTETIAAADTDVQVIHEYLGDVSGAYVILKTVNNGDTLFILKTNGGILAIDVAVRSQAGTWTNVTVFQTKQIKYATSLKNLIDFCYELDLGNRCSFYYSGTPPRVTYFKLQTTWTTQHAFIWNEIDSLETGNTDGFYTFENVADATRRQLTENFALVTGAVVNNTGGSLTTGNKNYFIRQCIGFDIKTSFGLASNVVSVFQASLVDPCLFGNVGGEPSLKSVTLTITGLNPLLYDSFELGYVENIDGALSEWVLTNKFPIEQTTITHTGFESKAALTPSDLLLQQIYLTSTGNEVINRDRLFSSDVTIQLTPPELQLANFTKNVTTITTVRDSISAIGPNHDTVNEFELTSNIFYETCYMLNETVRFGIQWKFKNGFICEPIFAKDHKFTDATGELTDAGIPTWTYGFFPHVKVDLSGVLPDINGQPFLDVIDGYSVVRCPIIPEILATGYVLPSQSFTVPSATAPFFVDNYCVGTSGADYFAGATDAERQYLAFLSPDLKFGQQQIAAQSGDQFLVYGQPLIYNSLIETRTVEINRLFEYNGDFPDAPDILNIDTMSESVPFNNGNGVKIKGTRAFNTTILGNIAGTYLIDMTCGALSIGLTGSDYANPVNVSNSDKGFYYAQYYRPASGKYGSESQGNYISMGHYHKLDGSATYDDNIFGGDTFTQKTFIKFNNGYVDSGNTYRIGLSFYSQNRANIQLRNFTNIAANNLDYPYTTTSLIQWLSGSVAGGAQSNEGQFNYSPSYTPITPVQIFPAYDSSLPVQSAQPSTLYYSELKIDGSPLDPYRTVLPLNSKSYSQYGRITNTFADVNMLILMMERAVLVQQLDQQQVTTDPNGVDLILGNGTVLGSREIVSSYFGSPMKTGAFQYLTKAGSWYIQWIEPYQKKVFRRGGDGIRVLTEENFIQTFMSNNNQYIGAENSILFGYDQWSQEVLMQAYTLSIPFTGYDAGATYTAGNVVSVARNIEGGVSAFYGDFYKARTNVPAGKNPTLIANQLNYWEIYRNSNYLLAFNEHDKINDYTSFYKFSCDSFIPYKDTFLTSITFVDGSFHENSHIFEHNKNTLKYYAASNGSGGTDVAGYVTLLFNEQPAITKLLRNIWISASNLILTNIHFRSSNGRTRTFSVQADIVEKRPDSGSWFSNVKRDATIGGAILPTGTNTTGANDLLTQAPEGETNEVTIFFTNDDDTQIGQINEVLLNGVPKPPYNNS